MHARTCQLLQRATPARCASGDGKQNVRRWPVSRAARPHAVPAKLRPGAIRAAQEPLKTTTRVNLHIHVHSPGTTE